MRGRKLKQDNADSETMRKRIANRNAYYKKTGKQKIVNQYAPTDIISGKPLSYYKEKHKQFEGTRLEKSINKPIFLTASLRKQQAES